MWHGDDQGYGSGGNDGAALLICLGICTCGALMGALLYWLHWLLD